MRQYSNYCLLLYTNTLRVHYSLSVMIIIDKFSFLMDYNFLAQLLIIWCVTELLNTNITLIILFLFIKYSYLSRKFIFCFLLIPSEIIRFLFLKLF